MKFESIKTLADLIYYISAHGMPTDEESICRMQDIMGHSMMGELIFFANNIGNEESECKANPEIAERFGKRNTREYFYQLLFTIWNWEDATAFWNLHTNSERDELRKEIGELRKKVSDLTEENAELRKESNKLNAHNDRLMKEDAKLRCKVDDLLNDCDESHDRAVELEGNLTEAKDELEKAKSRVSELEERVAKANWEIVTLKAKLYDAIVCVAHKEGVI